VEIPLYQVDAFADAPFRGNPAAVCPLDAWLPGETLQAIAAENNLSETAFFVREGEGYRLRWFTPAVEVDLCGHATLASAFVIFRYLDWTSNRIGFQSLSGPLSVTREEDLLALDFPSRPPQPVAAPDLLLESLGGDPLETWAARDYMVVYGSEAEVRALKPDMGRLAQVDRFAVIVTASGDDCDFVSRFFAPAQGIAEDPVTGSAHCTLIPFWAKRFGKNNLHARQVSARGGELFCQLNEERVRIAGRATLFLEGKIRL
jgi:PhzF family phenazine biosynthesis protein